MCTGQDSTCPRRSPDSLSYVIWIAASLTPPRRAGPADDSIDAAAASFAACTGTAPIDESSGDVVPQRLSRSGDRGLNSASMSWPSPKFGRTPRAGPITCGNEPKARSHKEAMRCLKRRLSDASTDNCAGPQTDWRQAREDTRGRLIVQRGQLKPRTLTHQQVTSPPYKSHHTTELLPGTT